MQVPFEKIVETMFVDNYGQKRLPSVKSYPSSNIVPKCQHDKNDGECAICEREERKKIIQEQE